MATKLKNMRLTSVDMVRNGANQEADICLFKSADPEEAPTQPTTEEKNIFKRFINWLRENPAEAGGEAVDPETVEKDYSTFESLNASRENNEKLWQYTNALCESIRSIQMDQDLDKDQKYQLMAQSLDQFEAAMDDLISALCKAAPTRTESLMAKSAAEEDEDDEEWEWPDEEDEEPEEDVEKFNPNHDASGRFTSGGGSVAGTGGSASASKKPAFGSTKPKFNGNGLAKITVYRGTMGKDWTEEKLTINGGTAKKTKDSVSYEGMDKAKNAYTVKYRLGEDGKPDFSRCDVIEKSADIDEIEEV